MSSFVEQYHVMEPRVPSRVNYKDIRGTSTVPEEIARLAYEEYEFHFGEGISFDHLHANGGFENQEIIGLLADLITRERKEREQEMNALTNDFMERHEHG